jgi:hypothetical protein
MGWQKKNRDKANRNERKYYRLHTDKCRSYGRKHYYDNAEKERERRRKRYCSSSYDKNYRIKYRSNPENKEKEKEYNKKWFSKNPHKRSLYDNMRRARVLELPNTLTHAQWEQLLSLFNHSCAYCGGNDRIAMDHLIPVSRKDINNPGTAWGNIVPACKKCNSKKNNKTHYEFCPKDILNRIYCKLESVQ